MMDRLKTLLERCKCSVSVEVNKHRDYYQTAAEFIEEAEALMGDCAPKPSPQVKRTMIETDTIIVIHFYPDTPIGFYVVWHFDLDEALKQSLECISKEPQ